MQTLPQYSRSMAVRFVFLIFIYLVIALTSAQEIISPCPRFFAYEPRTEQDRWYGVVTLNSNVTLEGIWLRLIFDNPSFQLGNWFGEVRTDDNISYLIKNRNHKLEANSPYALRFFLKYDPNKPVPNLVNIRLNAKEVCQEEKVNTTAIPFTNRNEETTPSQASSISSVPTHGTSIKVDICGRPSLVSPRPLIRYGQNSSSGEWPWHAALYRNNLANSEYICGASVITHNCMITAAHCVTDAYTGDQLTASKFWVHLGTASLTDFVSEVQLVKISRIRVHSKYRRTNFHNDIAILKSEKKIEYNTFVKPICLWEGDTNINGIVGELGTVVGWGKDETNKPSNILKQTRIPIVDTLECIYSKPEFFGLYTSPMSFCAGSRNGTGACEGDSGSGLVLQRQDPDGEKSWYLRGLVSVTVRKRDVDICDAKEYIIFTDVAKHLTWIQTILKEI